MLYQDIDVWKMPTWVQSLSSYLYTTICQAAGKTARTFCSTSGWCIPSQPFSSCNIICCIIQDIQSSSSPLLFSSTPLWQLGKMVVWSCHYCIAPAHGHPPLSYHCWRWSKYAASLGLSQTPSPASASAPISSCSPPLHASISAMSAGPSQILV